jgi:branched-chain amino acid transport system permease protein
MTSMKPRFLFLVLAVALLVALPPFLGLGWQNALTNMLIASLFAVSFNLLMGQGGMLSFGHAAYFGLGAFATLHLMTAVENGLGFPTALLPLAGALTGLLAGAVAGFFATQRSGVYFSLVTLAIAELLHSLAPHWAGAFGGESGLSSMRMPSLGVAVRRPALGLYPHPLWAADPGPARQRAAHPFPGLRRPQGQDPGLRHLGAVLRRRRRPVGHEQ